MKKPHMVIAAALVLLAIVIGMFKLPHITSAEGGRKTAAGAHDSVWSHRNLVMGIVGIFCYVGAESNPLGLLLVNYLHEPNIGNLNLETAAKYLSFYWGGAMVGRFLGSDVFAQVSPRKVLAANALIAAVLICASMATSGSVAMFAVLVIGFFNSIMFPTIFTLGIEGLGPLTGEGSGLLNTAIVGGRHHSLGAGLHRRQHRHSPCLHPAGHLLPLHCVLRAEGHAQRAHRVERLPAHSAIRFTARSVRCSLSIGHGARRLISRTASGEFPNQPRSGDICVSRGRKPAVPVEGSYRVA